MEDKESEISTEFNFILYLHSLWTNNVAHNSPEEVVSGLISSGISAQAQCHSAKVVVIPLLSHDKKFSLRRKNINIINSLLEWECPKYNLYTCNHELKWLNVDRSFNESLFYSVNLHLVKVGNEILVNETVAFYKYLKFHNYPTARSYKSVASYYLKNSDFPTLKTCNSNYASSKVKLNRNVSFQKSSSIAFVHNCKYVSTSKSYMLPSHNTPSCKKSGISPPISSVTTLSECVPSTMPGQNIQCTNAPSLSVTCSTVKSKRVNSDVNVIRKDAINVISDSVIASSVSVLRHLQTISLHIVTVIVLNILKKWLVKLLVFVKIIVMQIVITLEVGKRTISY